MVCTLTSSTGGICHSDPRVGVLKVIPEYMCHNPGCRLKQPDVELHGEILAGAPFENERYSRQLSAWYIPLALSGQQWDAHRNELTFSPDLIEGLKACEEADEGGTGRFVLPFFFATASGGSASGHLELPRCIGSTAGAGDDFSAAVVRLRVLAGDLRGVTVRLLEHATGKDAMEPKVLTLEAGEGFATIGTIRLIG